MLWCDFTMSAFVVQWIIQIVMLVHNATQEGFKFRKYDAAVFQNALMLHSNKGGWYKVVSIQPVPSSLLLWIFFSRPCVTLKLKLNVQWSNFVLLLQDDATKPQFYAVILKIILTLFQVPYVKIVCNFGQFLPQMFCNGLMSIWHKGGNI